ncbi:carbohydrate ABC transporter permease [Marinactinospora rubrisoli]|uniref:Carbohydrate ABC transporter permease n=1 Tax=Marinactinospora rubrisoli TaxID=2715399 RepID=A0ABW2KEK3_9ACTN
MTAAPRAPRAAARARRVPWLFLAPAGTLFVLVFALPIGYTVYLSLQRVRITGLGLEPGSRRQVFAGLANYRAVLTDAEFGAGILRVLGYGALLVPLMLGLALVFALLLDSGRARLRRLARVAIFLPYAVPSVIASLLWGFLYLPAVSPLLNALTALSLPVPEPLAPSGVVFALVNIGLWGGVGYNMIVIYTTLRAVPPELYEAARLDGCSEVQMALRIKIPLVAPALVLTGLFSVIATLQVFAEPMALVPLTNSLSRTWSPLMKIYEDAFVFDDIHAAAAMSVLVAAGTLLLSSLFFRIGGTRAAGGGR